MCAHVVRHSGEKERENCLSCKHKISESSRQTELTLLSVHLSAAVEMGSFIWVLYGTVPKTV